MELIKSIVCTVAVSLCTLCMLILMFFSGMYCAARTACFEGFCEDDSGMYTISYAVMGQEFVFEYIMEE